MKREYDFSKGERGKFYRPDAKLNFPVYLEPDIADYLLTLADKKNKGVETIVNDWLRRNIRLIKTAK
jgi:hypothetical protein